MSAYCLEAGSPGVSFRRQDLDWKKNFLPLPRGFVLRVTL
jgi:hypothetical protein